MTTIASVPPTFTVREPAGAGICTPVALAFAIPAGGVYVSGAWHLEGTIQAPFVRTTRSVTASGQVVVGASHDPGFVADDLAVTGAQLAAINALAGAGGGSYAASANDLVAIANEGGSPLTVDVYSLCELILTGCSWMIAPSSASYGPAGGVGSISVMAGAGGCPWTSVSNDSWIHITAGASGSGNGSSSYSVDANGGGPRTGTITIAGQTFTVMQTACGCTVTPSSAHYPSGGGSGSFAYATDGGCAWTAISDSAWLSITAGGSGVGSGTVSYTVAAQSDPSNPRTGKITVGNCVFIVSQDGIPATLVTYQVRGDPGEANEHQFIRVSFPFGYVQGVNLDRACGSLIGPKQTHVSPSGFLLGLIDAASNLSLIDPDTGVEVPTGAPCGPVDIWRYGH